MAVAGHGVEAVVLVEACRGLVDGVDDHQPRGSDLAGLDCSAQGVEEQLAAEALAVQGLVQCESGEEHRRYGVGCAASDPWGEVGTDDEVGGEADVGDDELVAGVPDEGANRAHRLGMARVLAKPGVERIVAA